jgi:hypothetical protein
VALSVISGLTSAQQLAVQHSHHGAFSPSVHPHPLSTLGLALIC